MSSITLIYVPRQCETLSYIIQYAMSQKLDEKSGTECFNVRVTVLRKTKKNIITVLALSVKKQRLLLRALCFTFSPFSEHINLSPELLISLQRHSLHLEACITLTTGLTAKTTDGC